MLLPHPTVDTAELAGAVRAAYPDRIDGTDQSGPVFVPLGEDSWCYRWGALWISVRRDRQGHFPAAYLAAHQLHSAGLDFLVAPLAGADGQVVRLVGGHPVVVSPHLAGRPVSTGPAPTTHDLDTIVSMLRTVHGSTVAADVPVEDYRFPFDDELDTVLRRAAAADPHTGPYSHRLHHLVRANLDHLRQLRAEAAHLAHACARDPCHVLSHGEPSAANILRSDGRLLLLDWTALAWGPPERDWFHLHRTLDVDVDGRAEFLRFYELRWILGEVSEYTTRFVGPHEGDDDDAAMWHRLRRYLP